jgi:hypothetical protein
MVVPTCNPNSSGGLFKASLDAISINKLVAGAYDPSSRGGKLGGSLSRLAKIQNLV